MQLDGTRSTPRELAVAFRTWLADHHDDLKGFRPAPWGRVGDHFERLRPFQQLLFDAGWSRYGWPADVGGLDGHPSLRGAVYDEVHAAGLDLPRGFELLEVVGPTLIAYAPQIAQRHLAALVSGRHIVCQGFSEPDAGSDLASLRTRAQLDGDDWHVSGQKVWISLGHIADWCLLLVRTDTIESRHRGLTMLWLDMRLPGVTVHPIDFADGRDELAEIFLDDVVVPAHCVVGNVGGGWDVAMFLLQFERGNYAWQRYAWMRAQLAHALRASRVSTRTDAVGGAFLDLVALAARARRTLLLLADGERLGPRTSIDKLLMSTAEQTIFDAARTITWPATELAERSEDSFEAEWFYSRAASVYGGAAEVQHDIIAEQVLGLPRR